MKIHIELCYKDGTKKPLIIDENIHVKGIRFLNAIDTRVNKRADLGEWERWNLVKVED